MIWFMCIRCKMITISIILYSCNVLVCGENVKKISYQLLNTQYSINCS